MTALQTMSNHMDAIEINGHKFKLGIRDLVYVIGLVITGVSLYFAGVNRDNRIETRVASLEESKTDISGKFSIAQTNANNAWGEAIKLQQQVVQNTASIAELNRMLRDMKPQVDKIDANVLWLMGKQMEKK